VARVENFLFQRFNPCVAFEIIQNNVEIITIRDIYTYICLCLFCT
jgi:hypothetical protein